MYGLSMSNGTRSKERQPDGSGQVGIETYVNAFSRPGFVDGGD